MKNLHKLENYLDVLNTKFSVIGLSETWFSPATVSLCSIQGYSAVSNYRLDRKGGGVSALINEKLNFSRRHDLETFTVDVESLFIEIDNTDLGSNRNVLIGVFIVLQILTLIIS